MANPAANPTTRPFGEWEHLRTRLVMAYRGASLAGTGKVTRRNDRYTLWRMDEGHTAGFANGAAFRTQRGRWCVPAFGLLTAKVSAGARLHSIHFEMTWPDGRPLLPWPDTVHLPVAGSERLDAAAMHLIDTVERHAPGAGYRLPGTMLDASAMLAVHAALASVAAALVESAAALGRFPVLESDRDSRLTRALTETNRLNAARAAGVSPRQLDRLFLARHGHSFRAHQEARRARHACDLLVRESGDCKTVASALGFRTLSQFSHWFRRHHGTSPRNYLRVRVG